MSNINFDSLKIVEGVSDYIHDEMSFLLYSEKDDVVVGVYRIRHMHANTGVYFASLIEQFCHQFSYMKVFLNPDLIHLADAGIAHVCSEGKWLELSEDQLNDFITYNAIQTPDKFDSFETHHEERERFQYFGRHLDAGQIGLKDSTFRFIYHLKDLVTRLSQP